VTSNQAIARAGLVVTGAFLVARLLGYVRTVLISSIFGASPDLDAFLAAFRVPDLMFQLVAAGALSSALIPVLAGLFAEGREARAWRVASTVAALMLTALTVICIGAWILAPMLVPFITPGFDEPTLEKTVGLTRLMLVAPILLAAGAVATSVLNARHRFLAASLAPVSYNLAIALATVLLAPALGVVGVAVGVVLGAAAHVLVQLVPLRRTGFRMSWRPETGDPAARRTFALMGPRALGLGASQIALIALTAFASTVGPGAITSFTVAFTLLQIPLGLIGVPLGVVLLPALSTQHAEGSVAGYARLVTRSTRLLLVTMLPIASLGIVLAGEVVTILFGYGNFSAEAIAASASTLAVLLIGLPAHAAIAVLARAFYATQDTRTPVAAALVAVAINIVGGYVLVGLVELPGLGAAVAAGAWAEMTLLLVILWRRVPGIDLAGVSRTLLLGLLAAGVAAVIAAMVRELAAGPLDPTRTVGALAVAIVATVAGGVAFLAMSLLLRIHEVPAATAVLVGIVQRRRES
jgi:putative peptidoglycan lipid II flippase